MSTQQPKTYVEWRELYQSTIYHFGHAALHLEQFRRLRAPDCILEGAVRHYWKALHRLQRIERRLDVEHEAMDETFCEEVARWALESHSQDTEGGSG